MTSNASVEREGSTLTVSFRNTPSAVSLWFGVSFVTMSLGALLLFGLCALIGLFLAWRWGGLRGVARGIVAGGIGAFAPFAMLALFFGVGVYLIRQGRKAVQDEAEVWILNRADRSFTVAVRKHEQRTGRRWLETRQVYSFPAPGSASVRRVRSAGDFDDYAVGVQTSSGEVVSDGTSTADYRPVVARINQFLGGN